jgi:hypothetical protein
MTNLSTLHSVSKNRNKLWSGLLVLVISGLPEAQIVYHITDDIPVTQNPILPSIKQVYTPVSADINTISGMARLP